MERIRSVVAAATALFALAGCAGTSGGVRSAQSADVTIDAPLAEAAAEPVRIDASAVLPAKHPIVIDNPYGDVRLRFGGYEHAVDLHAVLQQPEGAAAITLQPRDDGARYLIAPRLPEGALVAERQRIDLVVFVPDGHPVSARTEQGLIEARGLRSDLDLDSVSGDIALRGTAGTVDAATGAGSIEAALEPAPPGSRQRLATTTGVIVLAVGDDFDAELKLATSGVFATEYSLSVTHRAGQEPNKEALAVVGEAQAAVVVESRRGDIRLLRRAGFTPVQGDSPDHHSTSEPREAAMKNAQAP